MFKNIYMKIDEKLLVKIDKLEKFSTEIQSFIQNSNAT